MLFANVPFSIPINKSNNSSDLYSHAFIIFMCLRCLLFLTVWLSKKKKRKRFLINDSRSAGKFFSFSEVPEEFHGLATRSVWYMFIILLVACINIGLSNSKSQFKGIWDGRRWCAITVNHITWDIWYLLIALQIVEKIWFHPGIFLCNGKAEFAGKVDDSS